MKRLALSVSVCWALFVFAKIPVWALENAISAGDLGLGIEALSTEDLDAIEQESGYRVGVRVARVDSESAAAKAGLQKDDILLVIGEKGVNSPETVNQALADKSGKIDILLMRKKQGEFQMVNASLTIPDKEVEEKTAEQEGPVKAADIQAKLTALADARKAGVISDEEYARKKAELIGTGASEKAGAHGATRSKLFRHPIGFQFLQPVDWKVKEEGDALWLTPPSEATTPKGPAEIYLITGESVEDAGITRADDPQVEAYLDQQVQSLSPDLKRTGKATAVESSSGKGILYQWEGKSPEGKPVLARAYVNIIKGYGVALVVLGIKDRIQAREPVVQRMFASFGFQEGRIDTRIVGQWSLLDTYALTNWSSSESAWSRAKMARDTRSTISLRPDGSWNRVEESEMLAGAAGVWVESKDRKEAKGRWYAGDGLLYLVSEGDLWETYKYQLQATGEGRRLRLAGEKRGTLWSESK